MAYSERYKDIAVTHLNTEGFDALSPRQKSLAFWLAEAGQWGRAISLDQGSEHNIPIIKGLIELRTVLRARIAHEVSNGARMKLTLDEVAHTIKQLKVVAERVEQSLFILFAHNGIYHSTTGEKLELPLLESDLDDSLSLLNATGVMIVEGLRSAWFKGSIPQWRTVQKEGVDVVASSGSNFYRGLTAEEVKAWRADNYPVHEATAEGQEPQVPPYGFNERLVKQSDGTVLREVVCSAGLYGEYVKEIVLCLTNALRYTENAEQHASLTTLIDFYNSGKAEDFDKHCVAWTKDQSSDLYYINGLIESYDDPLGVCCGFESIVAFKNPLQTAKVQKIIDNIQWFENAMPFEDRFKKEKAQGLSASSVTVVSMAGETSPSLPLGINLPNSDWIRKVHGSKSVNLENSATSRSGFDKPLRDALYLPRYRVGVEEYLNLTNGLHTDLHEIAGHGSGKVLPGVNTDVLGAYYAVIEECRADLVALYFIADPKLKEFGVYDEKVDVHEAARTQYVGYVTNGVFGQLRRIKEGQDLTQAHFRNRQLISLWLLEHADPERLRLVTVDGRIYVEVNDVAHVRELVGQLLSRIQAIKSTGDFEGARDLVMTYGTTVNQEHLKQMHERIEGLDLPKTVCFVTPEVTLDSDWNVGIKHPGNFLAQQIELFNRHCGLSLRGIYSRLGI